MSEERITQEDLKVLAEYGRTMLSVQLFELALTGLVQINQSEPPEKVPFDEAWKQVQPLFGMTAGQLRKELEKQGNVPDDLLDEIQIAVTRATSWCTITCLSLGCAASPLVVCPAKRWRRW